MAFYTSLISPNKYQKSGLERALEIVKDPLGLTPRIRSTSLGSGISNKVYESDQSPSLVVENKTKSDDRVPYSSGNSGSNSSSSSSSSSLKDITNSKTYSESLAERQKREAQKAVASDWDDVDSSVGDTEKALNNMKSYISNLGSARDAYLKANDENLSKKKDAISGNRELIQKNQKDDLQNLAEDVRKSIFSANRNIGILGAANSSSKNFIAKGIQETAGKNRQETLKNYGDQISEQNQNEQNAVDTYNTQRTSIYDWEERNRKNAMDEFNAEKEILDKLKNKVPSWKQKDVEALSENNLGKLLTSLANISAQAKAWRDTLNSWITDMTGQATELSLANIDIDKPAELDTPEFSDNITIGDSGDQNTEDFYNPTTKLKRKQTGSDILDNSLIFKEE